MHMRHPVRDLFVEIHRLAIIKILIADGHGDGQLIETVVETDTESTRDML